MYIKIYTKSQLVLLRSVNRLFRKKYRLPQEILNRVEAILMVKDLGEHGFDESDTWLTKGKEWYMDTLKIKGEKSWIYALYSMTMQRIYK